VSQQLAALRRHLGDSPSAPVPATGGVGAVVVGSGKGGVGTSSVAALLALLAAAQGARTLLIDSDEGVGPLGLMLGVADAPGWSALRGGARPDELVVSLGERLGFLPGGTQADASALSPTERRVLFRRVSSLYPMYDLVIVDGGSRLEPVLAACGTGVARLLAVTTPDRISLAGCYALLKAVDARHPGVASGLVVNQSDATGAERAAATVAEAAQLFLGRGLALAAAVPDDLCLRAGMQAGMCLQDAADGSPAAASLLALADRLLDQPVAAVPPAATRTL
jgi:MinD-like ATPase involved in chromosome partitioning or flagellar assembly